MKAAVTGGDKEGEPGRWSARKAQMAVQACEREGGSYEGQKAADNPLAEWEREGWGTASEAPSGETGERYLPKAAREGPTDAEDRRSSDEKRRDTRKGRQRSAQPKDVSEKTARARRGEDSEADLCAAPRPRGSPAARR